MRARQATEAPRWTILLPTHDAPDTLGVSIASILAQHDRDFELLVIGDGMSDPTRAVAEGFDDPRIQVRDLPKAPGFGYSHRAAAIRGARGRDLAFASDDDLWAPDHLARLGRCLDGGADLAHSRSTWFLPGGYLVTLPFDLSDAALRSRFTQSNYIPSTCFVASRASVETAGGWPVDVDIAADWTLWKRIVESGARVASIARPTTVHFRSRLRSDDHWLVTAVFDRLMQDGWPDAVRVPVDVLPQLAVATAASTDGWWDALAASSDAATARLALQVSEAPSIRELEERLAAADARRQEVETEFRTSVSWRLTAPVRWVSSRRRRTD